MQLNLTTDYTIRAVLYMAQENELVTSIEIAEAVKVSPNYIFIYEQLS